MSMVHAPEDLTAPRFSSSALLLIDAAVDFLDGGVSAVAGTSDRLPHMVELVQAYRPAGRSCTPSGCTTATMSTSSAGPLSIYFDLKKSQPI